MQSTALFILLCIFLFVLKNDFKKNYKYLFWIALADIFVSTQLNMPVTVASDIASSKIKKQLSELPQNFPVPQNKPALMFSDSSGSIQPFWRNLGIFYKRPQFDGYNSFHLKGFDHLSNEPATYYPVLKNNIAFFSDEYSFFSDTIHDTLLIKLKSNHLFFEKKFRNEIKSESLKSATTDNAKIILFHPDKIKIESHTSNAQFLTLMQHDYPGWNVTLDGHFVKHFTSDYMFITILLPSGNHLIEYSFENKSVSAGLIVSVVSLLVCLALLIAKRKNSPGETS
jgi:hypothetical protein